MNLELGHGTREFSKDKTLVTEKQGKKCSTSLAILEIKFKTIFDILCYYDHNDQD